MVAKQITQSDQHILSPTESGSFILVTWGGGDSEICYQDNMVICQRGLWLLSFQALFCFQQDDYW